MDAHYLGKDFPSDSAARGRGHCHRTGGALYLVGLQAQPGSGAPCIPIDRQTAPVFTPGKGATCLAGKLIYDLIRIVDEIVCIAVGDFLSSRTLHLIYEVPQLSSRHMVVVRTVVPKHFKGFV